jgi:hypothetical protein
MATKAGDIITVESEDGILYDMVVKSVDQNSRTVTGDVLLSKELGRRCAKTITVPDHMIR